MNLTLRETIGELEKLRSRTDWSIYRAAVNALEKRKLPGDVKDNRPDRVHLSVAKRRKLLDKFGGRCHICKELIDPRSRWHVDHINSHLPDDEYNHPRNLAPAHPECNTSKGADSVMEHAKKMGRTAVDVLTVPEPEYDPNGM